MTEDIAAEEKAECVVQKYKAIQGFNKYSEDCFTIDEYKIDGNHWQDGFITWGAHLGNWTEDNT